MWRCRSRLVGWVHGTRGQQAGGRSPLQTQLLIAFEHIEAAFEALSELGDGMRMPVVPEPPDDAGGPWSGTDWPAWPPLGHVRTFGGPPALQAAMCLTTISVAADIRRPVGVLAHPDSVTWLVLGLLAHGRIPLAQLEQGRMRATDWPKLSKRLGELAEAPITFAERPADLADLPGDAVVIAWMPDTADVAGLRALAAGVGWGGYAAHTDPTLPVDWALTHEELRPMRLHPARLQLVRTRARPPAPDHPA